MDGFYVAKLVKTAKGKKEVSEDKEDIIEQ